jgi:hypothetical protein
MIQVTVAYGYARQTVQLQPGATFGDLKSNYGLRAEFGYGDNIRMLMNGIEMPLNAQVPQGAYVTIETAANTKAVLAMA